MTARQDRAVVIGGSLAGLLAARVLADVYPAVTVVERGLLPATDEPRREVPQSTQAHALQPRGQQIISDLFPGITQDMVADGAQFGDTAADAHWFVGGRPLRQVRSGLVTVMCSRPFLDRHVCARVRELSTVELVERCAVTGLVAGRDRVTGVRLATGDVLDADLVVDATGRGSRTPAWLALLDRGRVREDRVTIRLGYATRRYRIRPDSGYDGKMILVIATPGQPRGAICGTVEDDQFVVTLSGMLGDHPPADPAGFTAFARSLPAAVHDVIRLAEPLGDPVAHQFPASRFRRYDLLSGLPDGLVMVGDSVCSFNPIHAQGMSVAAVGADVLRRHIARGAPRSRAVMRDLVRTAVRPAWRAMLLSDLAHPGVPGRRTPPGNLARAYWSRAQLAATADERVADALLRVIALTDPFTALLHPGTATRILRRPDSGSTPARPSAHAPGDPVVADVVVDDRGAGPGADAAGAVDGDDRAGHVRGTR